MLYSIEGILKQKVCFDRHYGYVLEHLTHKLLLADPNLRPSAQDTLAMADLRPYVLRYHQRSTSGSRSRDVPTRRQSLQKDSVTALEEKARKGSSKDKPRKISDGGNKCLLVGHIYKDSSSQAPKVIYQ